MFNKIITIGVLLFFFSNLASAQDIDVEKLGIINDVFRVPGTAGGPSSPSSITVYEIPQKIEINNSNRESMSVYQFSTTQLFGIGKKPYDSAFVKNHIPLGQWKFGWDGGITLIDTINDNYVFQSGDIRQKTPGISFILKNNDGYIAFFVNKQGVPGAADTTGKIYSPGEALSFLKTYDPDTYEQSLQRAKDLGLEQQFINNRVLVWGQTYYSTPELLYNLWAKYLYPRTGGQIQYDLQGNGYMESLNSKSGHIWIVNPFAEHLVQFDLTQYSTILSTYERGRMFTSSTFVGFGGNIYFYIAGEAFTEVFRIRRTWGSPDFYAMAINGYTNDAYGKYVESVLAELCKDDLRLLRNHVFALYAYEFTDAALQAYFDKQVWYRADPSVQISALDIPLERRVLVEKIQEEERRR